MTGGEAPPEATEPDYQGPRPRAVPPIAVVAAVLAGALLVSTLVFVALWNNEKGTGRQRAAVALASGRFAERFLTLDSRDPKKTEAAVVALATGAFRRTFRQGFEAGLVPALVAVGQVRTEATVKEVFIGDLDDRTAHVIVHVGVVARPIDRPQVVTNRPDSWIELDLVKQGGRWLVDGVGDLKLGTGTTPDTGPNPTTTTTAPPAPTP